MEKQEESKSLLAIFSDFMIKEVPSYANKLFYSLGFLSMISFMLLIITGCIMIFAGSDWWLKSSLGVFVRSVHLWSTQAFVIFMILHLLIVFLTSGYKKPRRLTWVIGACMLFAVLIEAEFGYILRGDFSAQWRSLQGADLYNGSGLGQFINNLNYAQISGIHLILIPLFIIVLLFLHYVLIKTRGIAKPYKKDYPYNIVKANHKILFMRGGGLIGAILLLAFFFNSPFISPITIQSIAKEDPSLMAKTLLTEIGQSSGTATYLDNIDPYAFNTKKIYIDNPYMQYYNTYKGINMLALFDTESSTTQTNNLKNAQDFFNSTNNFNTFSNASNPVIPVIDSLIQMAQSGLYEDSLKSSLEDGRNQTYVTRFLADTGVLSDKATTLSMTTDQYGMVRDESGGIFPPGAWWLTPIGLLDHTILATDANQDRDGAEIIGIVILLLIAFPYIPFINKIPEKLGIDKLLWKVKQC